jgi:drug/metabolite transporter (DMT)-like permease
MAFASVTLGGPFLEQILPGNDSSSPVPLSSSSSSWQYNPWVGGAELGFWKSAGTTANLYGLSLTTADHGAFLIQLTTLIVPLVQGAMGVPIPKRIQTSIAMALVGITLFTQDHSAVSDSMDDSLLLQGDALCVLAAVFYATYDLRLFQWGKRINARSLMTSKIFTQALISVGLLLGGLGVSESLDLLQHPEAWCTTTTALLMAWSGLMVNCLVPFLQVGGQQAIGPTASQTIYSSQPLWAAMMSYFWFGETVGTKGLIGAGAFLTALFLAATTEPVKTDKE